MIGSLLVGLFGVAIGIMSVRSKARRVRGRVLLAIGALGILLAIGGASTQSGGAGGEPAGGGVYSRPQSLPAGVEHPDLWAQVLRAYPRLPAGAASHVPDAAERQDPAGEGARAP